MEQVTHSIPLIDEAVGWRAISHLAIPEDSPRESGLRAIIGFGHDLYVTTDRGNLLQCNVQHPEHPVWQATSSVPGSVWNGPTDDSGFLGIGDGLGNVGSVLVSTWRGVLCFDTTTFPCPPSILPLSGMAYGVATSDRYAFVAHFDNVVAEILVVEIARGEIPHVIGRMPVDGCPGRLCLHGGTLAATVDESIQFFDVSRPLTPARLSTYHVGSNRRVVSVAMNESVAVAVVEAEGVRILDISNPTAPQQIGAYPLPSHTTEDRGNNLILSAPFVHIANNWGGLTTLNLTRPEAPQQIAYLRGRFSVRAISLRDRWSFLATDGAGLVVAYWSKA